MHHEYPKEVWSPNGQRLIVKSAAEEEAVLNNTARIETIKSADGDVHVFAGIVAKKGK